MIRWGIRTTEQNEDAPVLQGLGQRNPSLQEGGRGKGVLAELGMGRKKARGDETVNICRSIPLSRKGYSLVGGDRA